MAGVRLRAITSVLEAPSQSTVHTMYRLTAAANHGILIYRVQVDLDPNGRSASKVAQVTLSRPDAAGSEAYTADNDPIKVRDDDETVQTDGDEKATTEPGTGSPETQVIIDSRQVSIGGTGITTVIFSYPRGLKIDGGSLLSVGLTEPNSPSARAKYQVTVDLEE